MSGLVKHGSVLLAALALAAAPPAFADSLMPAARWANVQLPDPAQERQAKALMEEIRCLVCAGQSVADSNAEMAGDMRSIIRERIQSGQEPETIRAWLISRYGEGISYAPPFDWKTAPLYAMPVLLLAAGLWLARGRFRRRGRRA
jgi:cytochrome c-type biogenesis protein CcmH